MLKQLPYKIHTNFELGMMLRKTKPLAFFSREPDHSVPVLERYFRMFDNCVAKGLFVRDIRPHAFGGGVEAVYYALPEEAWRIDAIADLHRKDGWTLADERREGELLGYEDWQNDFWIEHYGHSRVYA